LLGELLVVAARNGRDIRIKLLGIGGREIKLGVSEIGIELSRMKDRRCGATMST